MKSSMLRLILLLVWLPAFPAPTAAQSQPWYQKEFPPEEFRARWAAVFDRIGEDAVAVVQGAHE